MEKEKWKKVKEKDGYLISSWGRIYSLKRNVMVRPYLHKSRANRYLRVSLNGKKYMVHCLVAINYKRNQYEKIKKKFPYANIQVNHKDRNTLNCNLNNLEFETEEGNKLHLSSTNCIHWYGKILKIKMEKKNEQNAKLLG